MGIALIQRFGKRALWITHTKDLLIQSKHRAMLFYDKSYLGEITEGKVNIGECITFATVQTLAKINLEQYRDMWDVIIVDECHRCVGTPTATTLFYKCLNTLAARHKYGLSATVHRADGMIKACYALLGDIVYTVPSDEVADRVMTVGIHTVFTGINLTSACQNTDGTLNYAKLLTYLCEHRQRNEYIVKAITDNADCSCLILSDRLEHLETLMEALPEKLQKDAVMVSGRMTTTKGKAKREKSIEEMRQGTKKYLFATYALAKEGLDIPRLERLFLTTPQKDYAVITQSVGRIARVFAGKKNPICYDFVDNSIYLNRCYKKRLSSYKKLGCYREE